MQATVIGVAVSVIEVRSFVRIEKEQRGILFAHAPRKALLMRKLLVCAAKCKAEIKQMAIFARNLLGVTVFFFFFLRFIT